MSKVFKVGTVGCGGIWSGAHAQAWAGSADVKVVAVCDIVPEKAKLAADKAGLTESAVYTDWKQMLAKADLDVVDVCTPNRLHSEVAVAALEAGKHVFCEKPDAVSVAEAQRMADAAKRSGKTLMCMRNNRFTAGAQFLRKYCQSGQMGEIYAGRCGWLRRRGIPGKGGWFTTKALSGGGPLIDLGVHMIDVAVWLMGNPRPVAVSGSTFRKFAEASGPADSVHAAFGQAKAIVSPLKRDLAGNAIAGILAMGFIKFDNGACLQIEFSWASNIHRETRFIDLRGTKAGCSFLDGDAEVYCELGGTQYDLKPRLHNTGSHGHTPAILHYIDVLCGRAEPIFVPQQGVDMIKILTAIYESAESGKEVRV